MIFRSPPQFGQRSIGMTLTDSPHGLPNRTTPKRPLPDTRFWPIAGHLQLRLRTQIAEEEKQVEPGLPEALKTLKELWPRSARLGVGLINGVKQFLLEVGLQPDWRLSIRSQNSNNSPLRESQTLYNDFTVNDGARGDAHMRNRT